MANNEEPFLLSDLIRGHQKGLTDMEISNAIKDLTGSVSRINAAGKITIVVSVRPQKTQDGDSVLLSIDHAVTLPKTPAEPSLYFIGDDGRPQKRSPRQPLAFGDVTIPGAEREV